MIRSIERCTLDVIWRECGDGTIYASGDARRLFSSVSENEALRQIVSATVTFRVEV